MESKVRQLGRGPNRQLKKFRFYSKDSRNQWKFLSKGMTLADFFFLELFYYRKFQTNTEIK